MNRVRLPRRRNSSASETQRTTWPEPMSRAASARNATSADTKQRLDRFAMQKFAQRAPFDCLAHARKGCLIAAAQALQILVTMRVGNIVRPESEHAVGKHLLQQQRLESPHADFADITQGQETPRRMPADTTTAVQPAFR